MFNKILDLFKRKKLDNKGVKILVVEDNDVDLKVVENILNKYDFSVITARNGQEGLNTASEQSPNLIILDCEMPILNGIEMCKKLKDNPKTKNIPVLFLTGVKTPSNVIECFEADAENYLDKPVNSKVLISEVELLLSGKASKA